MIIIIITILIIIINLLIITIYCEGAAARSRGGGAGVRGQLPGARGGARGAPADPGAAGGPQPRGHRVTNQPLNNKAEHKLKQEHVYISLSLYLSISLSIYIYIYIHIYTHIRFSLNKQHEDTADLGLALFEDFCLASFVRICASDADSTAAACCRELGGDGDDPQRGPDMIWYINIVMYSII